MTVAVAVIGVAGSFSAYASGVPSTAAITGAALTGGAAQVTVIET